MQELQESTFCRCELYLGGLGTCGLARACSKQGDFQVLHRPFRKVPREFV